MANTTNFNWATPDDTDLVKDGAAAIRTLGSSIDTSFVDLKGGTTGQVLSKATNTDLDYTWITPNVGDITEVQAGVGISVASGTGPIPIITNSSTDLITTAGDILYGTAADTVARLGIGTAGQVLKVNSGATAPEWAAAGGINYSSMATVATEQTTTSTTFTDLTTSGPAVTVTTGTTAIIVISCGMDNEASGRNPRVGFAVSGATTIAATSTQCLRISNEAGRTAMQSTVAYVVSGLTAGSNTFTLKYLSSNGGTVSFVNRNVFVIS